MTHSRLVRIGTRASKLARWQANWVAARLAELPDVDVELVEIRTMGDHTQVAETPISAINQPGAFTKEIQRALLDGRVDVAVHSLKDLPTDTVDGLCLAAVPERAAAADVLVSPRFESLDALPKGAVVGTGSLRRQAQLRHVRPDLVMRDIRGNVETRLEKLVASAGEKAAYDAAILAEAGLRRLGLESHITEVLPSDMMLPAVGQGALGIETRADDTSTIEAVQSMNDVDSQAAVMAERAMLATLRGGCLAPVAALARVEEERLRLQAAVLSGDGRQRLGVTVTDSADEPVSLGIRAAEDLLNQGAASLIDAARRANS